MHYATTRMVADSNPDKVDFSVYLILQAALCLWGGISLYQKLIPNIFLRGKRRPAHKGDNLTAICEQ
jgi:hypothetical protein